MLGKLLQNKLNPKAILYPFLMVGTMWLFFFAQHLGFFESCRGAIIPLLPSGLTGVIFSPLLHGGFDHIIGNSVPVFILMFLLFQFYPKLAGRIFIFGWLLSGLLVWLLPPIDVFTGEYRYVCIIGASGLVYMLAFFLFFSGVLRRERPLLVVSLLVALYYGSLIWGVLPEEFFSNLTEPSRISWQAHLAGAVVGIMLAFVYRKTGEKKKRYIWEFPNYYTEKDDKLWQDYIQNHPEDFREMPQKKEDVWRYLDEIRRKNP